MARLLFHLSVLVVPLAAAVPSQHGIFARQNDRCGGESSLTPCGNGFPANFCCGAGTRCVPLNNTRITTTICCPNGKDCARIQPIACNITLQNAQLFPLSSIHTLNLTQELPKCQDACCPAGFRCENDDCVAINDKQQSSSTARPTTSAPTASTSSKLASSTGTGAAGGMTSSQQSQTTSSTPLPLETIAPGTASSFSGKSFAAGFVPGILLGAALLFGIIFSLARRRRKREEVTEITIPPGGAGGLSSAKSAFGRRKNRRQISDPVVQPQFSTRTAFYHSSSPSKPCSDISASTATSVLDSSNAEKALPIPHSRKRSSSTYDTNTMGYPATPFSHTASDFHVNSLFHQSPNPNNPTTTPMPPPPPPIDSSPTPKGSITPPNPLRNKKSQGSLRRQLSRFRKTSAPSPGVVSRTSSKRRRVGSWSSGDDRSLSGDERNGRESRGTIRVVMSPPRQGPLPMGFGPVLRANMPPPSWAGIASQQTGEQEGGGMKNILPSGMAYGHTDLPYPERVQANSGEKRAGQGAYTLGTPPQAPGQGFLGSPYTPSKNGGKAGQVLGANRQTTFGEMMERAGVERRDLDRARGALYGK